MFHNMQCLNDIHHESDSTKNITRVTFLPATMQHTVRVRLTRKLAAVLNGVDVSSINSGDVIELPPSAAAMLIAEGWAESVGDCRSISPVTTTAIARA
jgi:hypothetical protein